jgi:hypothetical protein
MVCVGLSLDGVRSHPGYDVHGDRPGECARLEQCQADDGGGHRVGEQAKGRLLAGGLTRTEDPNWTES